MQSDSAAAAPVNAAATGTALAQEVDDNGHWVFRYDHNGGPFAGNSMTTTITDGSNLPVEVEWVVGAPGVVTTTVTDTQYPAWPTEYTTEADGSVNAVTVTRQDQGDTHLPPVATSVYTKTVTDHQVTTTWTGHPDGHPEISDLFVLEDYN